MLKIALLAGKPNLRLDGAGCPYLLPPTPNQICWESHSRLRESLPLQNILEELIHMFPYELTRKHQLQHQDHAEIVGFYQL